MRRSFFIYSLFLFSYFRTEAENIKTDTLSPEISATFHKMQASINCTTQEGHAYTMYAIKVRKDWVFLVMDSLSIYSVKFNDHHDQLIESDKNFTNVICLSAQSNSLKKINKTITIAGTELQCYYQMQSKASRMYASLKKSDKKANGVFKEVNKNYKLAKREKSKIKMMSGKFLKR